jgi:hypothetical protein
LIVRKNDFSSETNLKNLNDSDASNLISFSFYHPDNKSLKLNTTPCETTPVKVVIPLKKPERLNFYAIVNLKIDQFNPTETAFISRCKTSKNE